MTAPRLAWNAFFLASTRYSVIHRQLSPPTAQYPVYIILRALTPSQAGSKPAPRQVVLKAMNNTDQAINRPQLTSGRWVESPEPTCSQGEAASWKLLQ